jgi:hypothetical protein
VTPGAYRTFGSIILNDEKLFSARHVARIARFDRNDPYMASDVEDLRSAIVATGLVSSVTLTPKDAGDGEHVDLAVDVHPAPLRTIAGELGYGTGEGYRAAVSWQHRNLFPPEGAVTLRGVLGTQEQTASFTYRRNNFRKRDHVLTGLFSVSNIRRDAYDARTITLSGALERQSNILFQKKWVWRVGTELIASDERDAFSGGSRRTFLIAAVPLSLTYDGSDDLLNPTSGFRLGGRLSPELSFQNRTFGYSRVQLDGSIYQPVGDRIVFAARARFGTILGSTVDQIAPSRRFYAGGGASVRGYGYQAIGPRDADNDPIGGKSLAEFSLESRVRQYFHQLPSAVSRPAHRCWPGRALLQQLWTYPRGCGHAVEPAEGRSANSCLCLVGAGLLMGEDQPQDKPRRRRAWDAGWQRWLTGLFALLLVITAGAVVWLDTSAGHRFLASRIAGISPPSGLRIRVDRIEGSIYRRAVLHGVTLSDPNGVFLAAPRVELDWWPLAWLSNLSRLPGFTNCRGSIPPGRKGRSFPASTFG